MPEKYGVFEPTGDVMFYNATSPFTFTVENDHRDIKIKKKFEILLGFLIDNLGYRYYLKSWN